MQDDTILSAEEDLLRPCAPHYVSLTAAKALRTGDLLEVVIGPVGAQQIVRAIVLCRVPGYTSQSLGNYTSKPCMDTNGQMQYGHFATITHSAKVILSLVRHRCFEAICRFASM